MNVKLTTATLQKFLAYGRCSIKEVKGFNGTGGDLYIQFHEKPVVLAGDIPKSSGLIATTAQWFDWFYNDGLDLSECSIAISSSQTSYAAPAAGVDCTVIFETQFPACNEAGTALVTVVGDLTSAVDGLGIWAEAAGPKRLLRLDVKNNDAATRYIVIQSSDAELLTDSTVPGPFAVATGATKTLFFGNGLLPFRNDNGTIRKACVIRMSSSATLPFVMDTDTDFNIRAIYAED